MTAEERAPRIISHSDALCEASGALIVRSQELIEKADRLVADAPRRLRRRAAVPVEDLLDPFEVPHRDTLGAADQQQSSSG